jgi:putative chitinase
VNYLKLYQEKLGLVGDGIIGKMTAAAMMADLGIDNKLFFAHLMGQIAHESGLYTNARENMNYNEAGLLNIFRKYYVGHPGLAEKHARKPQLIANHVYANRMGNGDEASGDGWKYRGIFGLQLTGKRNIQDFIRYLGLPEDTDPDSLLDDPKNYFLAGKFWFIKNAADDLCTSTKNDCILRVSRLVNIGNPNSMAIPHGLENRITQTKAMFRAVGVA